MINIKYMMILGTVGIALIATAILTVAMIFNGR